MNKLTQTKEDPNQPDQPEYKDQPLPDVKSNKSQNFASAVKERKTVKSFKDLYLPILIFIFSCFSLQGCFTLHTTTVHDDPPPTQTTQTTTVYHQPAGDTVAVTTTP